MKISVNPNKCTGCGKCIDACKTKHNIARITIKKENDKSFKPLICRQCDSPECAKACTYEAIYRNKKTQAVLIDSEICQACHACIRACPFNSIVKDPESGIALTCDLCDGDPLCIKACEFGAIEIIEE